MEIGGMNSMRFEEPKMEYVAIEMSNELITSAPSCEVGVTLTHSSSETCQGTEAPQQGMFTCDPGVQLG